MIKKAVLPVAGLGTRFLPASKATPKEMLPIIDKPLVQYAVEEAINVGINEIIFITSPEKNSIKNHFNKNEEIESKLIKSGKKDMVNKRIDVIRPKIIVVPMLKNVEETIAGITNKKEKGLKIPPVK